MAKVERLDRTAFVISNLLVSDKKDEKVVSLLSHLDTRGQKSATEGLVVLKRRSK